MCTQWLWSYPVDVAVAVAQYSDRTYFFQTPASSIPVLKKEWKEKKAKLWPRERLVYFKRRYLNVSAKGKFFK